MQVQFPHFTFEVCPFVKKSLGKRTRFFALNGITRAVAVGVGGTAVKSEARRNVNQTDGSVYPDVCHYLLREGGENPQTGRAGLR